MAPVHSTNLIQYCRLCLPLSSLNKRYGLRRKPDVLSPFLLLLLHLLLSLRFTNYSSVPKELALALSLHLLMERKTLSLSLSLSLSTPALEHPEQAVRTCPSRPRPRRRRKRRRKWRRRSPRHTHHTDSSTPMLAPRLLVTFLTVGLRWGLSFPQGEVGETVGRILPQFFRHLLLHCFCFE